MTMNNNSSKFLQDLVVNHEENGIKVVLNAEPIILQIKVNFQKTDKVNFDEELKNCINNALQETAKLVIQEATKKLDDKLEPS
jgi:hypothetical protein